MKTFNHSTALQNYASGHKWKHCTATTPRYPSSESERRDIQLLLHYTVLQRHTTIVQYDLFLRVYIQLLALTTTPSLNAKGYSKLIETLHIDIDHPKNLKKLQSPYFFVWKPQKVAILAQSKESPIENSEFASFTSYLQRKFHLVFQQLSVVNQHQAMSGNAQNGQLQQ